MDLGIAGRTALVTGASRGIGRAIVRALHDEGVTVIAAARGLEGLQLLEKELAVETIPCDLTDEHARARLLAAIDKRVIDIVVHNVGGPAPSAAGDTTQTQWQEGFERLFLSVSQLNAALVPAMCQREFGRVVCVTSLSVLEPIAGLAVSNAMRAGVTAMLKTLADECATSGVTVNCVAPGAIDTERLRDLMQARILKSGQTQKEYERDYLKTIPMARLGTPLEFASAVAYLCSVQAAYITGTTLCVDGGKKRATY